MAVNLNQTKGIKTRQEPTASRVQTGQPKLLKWVLVAFVVSAVLELILWRTFTRIGIFIPKKTVFQTVYDIGSNLGRIVLNFAVLLSLLSLALAVGRLRGLGRFANAGSGWLRVAVVAIGLVLILTLMQLYLVQNTLVSLLLRLALLAGFGTLAADYWRSNADWKNRLFISLLLAAYGMQILSKLLYDEPLLILKSSGLDELYLPMVWTGEAAVLANGFGVFLAYGGGGSQPLRSMTRNWKPLLGALAVGGAFLALTFLTIAESDIVPILGLYALGYTMQLPLGLYVIALFFLLYTVFFNLAHQKEGSVRRAAGFGLILVFAGGYLFNVSNQYIFALAGVLLLTRPEIVEDW